MQHAIMSQVGSTGTWVIRALAYAAWCPSCQLITRLYSLYGCRADSLTLCGWVVSCVLSASVDRTCGLIFFGVCALSRAVVVQQL